MAKERYRTSLWLKKCHLLKRMMKNRPVKLARKDTRSERRPVTNTAKYIPPSYVEQLVALVTDSLVLDHNAVVSVLAILFYLKCPSHFWWQIVFMVYPLLVVANASMGGAIGVNQI